MNAGRARILAGGLWVLSIGITVVTLAFVWMNRSLEGDGPFIAVAVLFILAYVTTGAAIVSRLPKNPIGWLFIAVGLGFLLGGLADEWVRYAAITNRGQIGGETFFVWLSGWVSILAACIPLIFILFPDGHPPTRRWRPVVVLLAGGIVLGLLLGMFTPGPAEFTSGSITITLQKPVALAFLDGSVGNILAVISVVAITVGAFAAIASLVLRWRRAVGDERQQIRWVATAAGFAGMSGLAVLATSLSSGGEPTTANNIAFFALLISAGLGVPLATGVAVLRYRLYDLGLVVKKTLVFAVVATMLTALYGILVFIVPLLVLGVGSGSGFSPWQYLVTIVIALSFAPVRRRARKLADRIVYGGRATPYEVLSDFSERLAESYSTDDVLPRMRASPGGHVGRRHGERAAGRARLGPSTTGDRSPRTRFRSPATVSQLPADLALEVRHQGSLLGALSVTMHANDPMNTAKERLVRDLAAQAGLVLRNVRLIEALRDSRRRLVAAQDQERRKLERNIHDGAQQQLVALQVKQRLAEQLLDRDPAKARDLLGQLQTETAAALDDLRDLARGVYPLLLADRGLAAALEGQPARRPCRRRWLRTGSGGIRRTWKRRSTSRASRRSRTSGSTPGRPTSSVSLSQTNGELRFTVVDDGRGFDPATPEAAPDSKGWPTASTPSVGPSRSKAEPGGARR